MNFLRRLIRKRRKRGLRISGNGEAGISVSASSTSNVAIRNCTFTEKP